MSRSEKNNFSASHDGVRFHRRGAGAAAPAADVPKVGRQAEPDPHKLFFVGVTVKNTIRSYSRDTVVELTTRRARARVPADAAGARADAAAGGADAAAGGATAPGTRGAAAVAAGRRGASA